MAHTASCGHCVVASPPWAGYTSCGNHSSEVSQAQASPYNIQPLEAPAASNEDIRAATAAAIDAARIPHDPEFDCTLRVLCSVFDTDTAFISIITGDTITLPNACGMVPPGYQPPRRLGLCAWAFLTPVNRLVVVEDTRKDARFRNSPMTNGEYMYLVFYAAAPLVTSNGQRVGTLCIAAPEPRKFDDQRAMVLNNLAELVVRKLERNWALQQWMGAQRNAMMRSIDCYERGYLFVDAQQQPWRILHMNQPASEQTRVAAGEAIPLWSLFELRGQAEENLQELLALAAHGKPFTVPDCSVAQCPTPKNALQNEADRPSDQPCFDLVFRPANSDVIDMDAQPLGIPSFVASGTGFGIGYYFVELQSSQDQGEFNPQVLLRGLNAASNCTGSVASSFPFKPMHTPFPGLELGTLLGQGGYGRVYRATWHNQEVAVKIIDDVSSSRCVDGMPLEAAVVADLDHPAIVRVLAQRVLRHHDEDDPGASRTAHSPVLEGWLVLELCDRGTLADAVVKGWMCTEHSPTVRVTNVSTVASLAYDIAQGMAVLHGRGIRHGDLCSGNILLQSNLHTPHGYSAKIADFGLSREDNMKARLSRNDGMGTIAYLPPEAFAEGKVSKAADVYAMGVILFEMLSHTRAWAGMLHAHIIYAVAVRREKLKFTPDANPALVAIAERCMEKNPALRPSFADVAAELAAICTALTSGPA